MANNDFIKALTNKINTLNLPLEAQMDYLHENDCLVVYSLPGGSVVREYMDGARDVSLNYEIAVKVKDNQEIANAILWQINDLLSDFTQDIPSENDSYKFLNLSVGKPYLNDRSEQGFYVYFLDISATISIIGGKK